MNCQLTSSAFSEGSAIPNKHTCDDRDASPPLKWSGAPANAKSLALICDDPDAPAGAWVHWVLFNIPATATGLPEGVPATQVVLGGAKQGVNDFQRLGYGGAGPPRGTPHRDFFQLYRPAPPPCPKNHPPKAGGGARPLEPRPPSAAGRRLGHRRCASLGSAILR